jgi:hypothetical protein
MKACSGEIDVHVHLFLTSALDGVEWSASHPGCFDPWERNLYQLNRRLNGPQIHSRYFGEEKSLLSLPGIEPIYIEK